MVKRIGARLAAFPLMMGLVATGVEAQKQVPDPYARVIGLTAWMVRDPEARRLVGARKLSLVDLTWEDTGRFKGSSVGPNISDMTIQVHRKDPGGLPGSTCMPVIRHDNFGDRTGDVSPDRFFLLVGNEQPGGKLRKVSLRQYLGEFRSHLSDPQSWAGARSSLLAERDEHVLVSAQACFLPVPREGEATFNPVLFNYQSVQGDAAVLAILATREGTSATVIDNRRDGFAAGRAWGQRLFFNKQGERASLTGKRKGEWLAQNTGWVSGPDLTSAEAAGTEGLNLVMLIQVPLKQKRPRPSFAEEESFGGAPGAILKASARSGSDVEDAVIGHGAVEGPFVEIDGQEIERDPRFPVRVTVQFYKATSNGVLSEADVAEIAGRIERVYEEADYVGSLVTDGETDRPTEHAGPKVEPPGWWAEFWNRHMQDSGLTREAAEEKLRKRFGENWRTRPRTEVTNFLRWETW